MKIKGKIYTASQLAKAKKFIVAYVMDEFDHDKPLGSDEWPYELPRAMGLKCDDDGDFGIRYDDVKAIAEYVLK